MLVVLANSLNHEILVSLPYPVIQQNVMSVTPVVWVNSLNHYMFVNLSAPVMQQNILSVRSVVLVNLSKHQLLVNLSVIIWQNVMNVAAAVSASSSKHLMLVNLSVPVMRVILSCVIPLVSLFLILLVIASQLYLFINLLMWTRDDLVNDLLTRRAVLNIVLQNHLVP